MFTKQCHYIGKDCLETTIKIVNVIHPHESLLKNSLKTTTSFYQLLLKKVATQNTKANSKWHVDLNLEDTENWSQHFAKLYCITETQNY